jgi:AcrR family transcriptional regulator
MFYINFVKNLIFSEQCSILVDMSPSNSREKEGKRRLILDTFAKIVNENGYDSLSTRDIAKEAGIGVGTIYHYFPDGKHSIAMGYMERLTQNIFNPEMFMSATDDKNLKKLYQTFIMNHLKLHRENLELHRAIDQAILADPKVREQNSMIIKKNLESATFQLIRGGMFSADQSIQVIRNFLFNFHLIEAVIHRHLLVDPFYETDEELVEVLSMTLLGLHQIRTQN